jgi:zinc protease
MLHVFSGNLGRVLTSYLCAMFLFACAADGNSDVPPAQFDTPLAHSTLDNGLELAVVPNGTVPLITTAITFRAGASTEDNAVSGYSHLFEHMIFKGSEDVPDPVEFYDRLQSLGVSYNAFTSVDTTTYYFTAERDFLEESLDLFAAAIRRPALTPEEFEREKEVVLAEFDLDESDWDYVMHERMLKELFGDYFSRVFPLGSRDAVSSATSDRLRDLYARYYLPSNALIIFSGDITKERGTQLAERYFGDWARGKDPAAITSPSKPAPFKQSRYGVISAPVSETTVLVAWRGPGYQDDPKGTLAGALLSDITLQTSHNFRSLVGSDVATSAALYTVSNRLSGYVYIKIGIPLSHENAVFEVLINVLERFGKGGDIFAEQLDAAKDNLWRSYFLQVDDPSQVPFTIADQWGLADIDSYQSYVDDLYDVSEKTIARFINTYMRNQPHVVLLMSDPDNISEQGIDEAWLKEQL